MNFRVGTPTFYPLTIPPQAANLLEPPRPCQWVGVEELLQALGPEMRSTALEMSDRLSLPLDLIIINMISAICSVYQGLVDYENLEGRARPISENIVIVGPKTSGKTKADRAIFDGLRDLDRRIGAAQVDVNRERTFHRKLWREREKILLRHYRSDYGKVFEVGSPVDIDVSALEQHDDDEPIKVFSSQLFYEKMTLGGIEKLICRQGIAFTVASDEGKKTATSGILKNPCVGSQGFDGSPQSVETAFGTSRADDYRFSLRLDFQPDVFEQIFLAPGNELDAVGLVERCLYCSVISDSDKVPQPVKGPAEQRFLAGLLRIAEMYAYLRPKQRELLRFSDKAKGAWPYLNEQVKQTSQWGGPLVRMPTFQRRLMEHAERIACALHLGEQMLEGSGVPGEICADTISNAATIAKYYAQHALSLFLPATQTQQERDAIKLQARLDDLVAEGVSWILRNELLNSDVVPGKARFDPAMRLVRMWGRYTTVRVYRQGSLKTTVVVVLNVPQAIAQVQTMLLPPIAMRGLSPTDLV